MNDKTEKKLFIILLILVFFVSAAFGIEYDFIVAKDGSGDFVKLQDVIDTIPHLRKKRTYVFIKNGIYKEKLILPMTKTNISFIGENVDSTIITYDDFASRKNIFGENIGTSGSSGFFVNGEGFIAENITFSNTAGLVGQAVAVRVFGDKVMFKNCKFLGFQDTLYPRGEESRQYYKGCYIEGTVDFIFGWSTAVFDSCHIHSLSKKGGYITAASTLKETPFGFVFINCRITGEPENINCYLGRPWRPYAKVVYVNCYLGSHIASEGWNNWGNKNNENTAYYAEYHNYGPGSAPDKRVSWSHQLTKEEAQQYTIKNIFKDWDPGSGE